MSKKKRRILEVLLPLLLIAVFIIPFDKLGMSNGDYSIDYIVSQYGVPKGKVSADSYNIGITYDVSTSEIKMVGCWSNDTLTAKGSTQQKKLLAVYISQISDDFGGNALLYDISSEDKDLRNEAYEKMRHDLSEKLKSEGR